jgi:hypothetical protein
MYEKIVKGQNVSGTGIPRILQSADQGAQSLGLDVDPAGGVID